ncbi:MAG: family N-acetyltransferase [Mucilaginibacter sp.]|jgi:GNAT superfamily N-acetyltransferase|nr:family N-acetyltransferase [Mucilaginibacter sp.]
MDSNDTIELKRTDSNDPDFRYLIPLLDKDLQDRYGALQSVYDQYNHIINIDTVMIAYHGHTPAGCGCFKQIDDGSVEIKRMFVKPAERGKGIASSILTGLELWAKEAGFLYTLLETGNNQPEAISLYKKAGYTIVPNYGQYSGMETSICMRKAL